MKISVLVPVYGVERYIRRCAESLFRQTMTDGVEFIFVDDASPDGSIGILRQVIAEHPGVDARIVTHEKNKGVAAARHTAIGAARGEFFTFVDSDDYVDPEFLEHLYDKALTEDADIVFSDIIEEQTGHNRIIRGVWAEGYEDLGIAVLVGGAISLISKLIRRSIYTEHAECKTPDDMKVAEDYLLTIIISHFSRKFARTDEALYHYDRTNETSLTHGNAADMMESIIRLWQYADEFFAKEYPDGRYADVIGEAKVRDKYDVLLYHNDMKARRRYADL